jgi:hypothetical protein
MRGKRRRDGRSYGNETNGRDGEAGEQDNGDEKKKGPDLGKAAS